MIKAYGAQMPPDQVPVIVDYLTKNYGAARPAQVAVARRGTPPSPLPDRGKSA